MKHPFHCCLDSGHNWPLICGTEEESTRSHSFLFAWHKLAQIGRKIHESWKKWNWRRSRWMNVPLTNKHPKGKDCPSLPLLKSEKDPSQIYGSIPWTNNTRRHVILFPPSYPLLTHFDHCLSLSLSSPLFCSSFSLVFPPSQVVNHNLG